MGSRTTRKSWKLIMRCFRCDKRYQQVSIRAMSKGRDITTLLRELQITKPNVDRHLTPILERAKEEKRRRAQIPVWFYFTWEKARLKAAIQYILQQGLVQFPCYMSWRSYMHTHSHMARLMACRNGHIQIYVLITYSFWWGDKKLQCTAFL